MGLIRVNDLVFANNAALGLEPVVSTIQHEMVWAKGLFRYLLAAVRGIIRNQAWEAEITWDDGGYAGPATAGSRIPHPAGMLEYVDALTKSCQSF